MDSRLSAAAPNGNTTAFAYDKVGPPHEQGHDGRRPHQPRPLRLDLEPGGPGADRSRDDHRRRRRTAPSPTPTTRWASSRAPPLGHHHRVRLGQGTRPDQRPGGRRHRGHDHLRRRRPPDLGRQPHRDLHERRRRAAHRHGPARPSPGTTWAGSPRSRTPRAPPPSPPIPTTRSTGCAPRPTARAEGSASGTPGSPPR